MAETQETKRGYTVLLPLETRRLFEEIVAAVPVDDWGRKPSMTGVVNRAVVELHARLMKEKAND